VQVTQSPPREWVRAWRPAVAGISEVFHARFVEHRYPPHAHDDWTLFVVDAGAIRYDLDTRSRGAERARVAILPPHVVHDGRPASAEGFRKRVLYVRTELLPAHLIGPAVDEPDLHEPGVVRMVGRLHDLLEHADDALEAEAVLALVAERIRRQLDRHARLARAPRRDEALAGSLRELLDAHVFDHVTLADAGRVLGATTPQLVRAFGRTYGVTPHRYLIGRRIEAARKRLLEGEPVAMTAAVVGFYDQAHFTHHFRRHVGTTPNRFATSSRRTR
jgi:AraC-like DNA-binding protein